MMSRMRHSILPVIFLVLATGVAKRQSKEPQPRGTMDFRRNSEDMGGSSESFNVHFVTVETRAESEVVRLAGPKGWDFYVRNLGFKSEWRWFETKLRRLTAFLETPGDNGENVDTIHDNDVLVWLDGEDVMYGGCDLSRDFLPRFLALEEIARESQKKKKKTESPEAAALDSNLSAPIIFGAEFNCFEVPERLWGPHGTPHSPAGCNKKSYRVNKKKRLAMLRRFGLSAAGIDAWASSQGPGADGPSLLFLNSGFFAGRAGAVREFLPRWLAAYQRANQAVDEAAAKAADRHALKGMKVWFTEEGPGGEQRRCRLGDQAGAQLLWDEGDAAVALDYGGLLVNNVALRQPALVNQSRGDGSRVAAFSYDARRQTWMDGATSLPLCFLHLAGGAEKDAIAGMEQTGHDYRRTWSQGQRDDLRETGRSQDGGADGDGEESGVNLKERKKGKKRQKRPRKGAAAGGKAEL